MTGSGDLAGAGFAVAAARLAGMAGAVLGWRPAEFWAATPAELASVVSAIGGDGAEAALTVDQLDALRARFPDPGDVVRAR